MEFVWFAAGFLIGMSLWMPTLVASTVESRLVRMVTSFERVVTRSARRGYG
jgi:hypothetical protein